MSFKSDNAMLTSLGTPENWSMPEGCHHTQPYAPSDGERSHASNIGREINNNRYGPRWMGWADE